MKRSGSSSSTKQTLGKVLLGALFVVAATLFVCAQGAGVPQAHLPPLPKDAADIFAAAAPLYDFNSPSLKPWHMKVSYQLYDDKGESSETGT